MLVKEGATDYLSKPWDDQKVLASVRNLLALRRLKSENDRLKGESGRARRELAEKYDLCGLVYESEAMHRVVSLAVHVAPADVPVLITGPNGSGKEKLAEIVQANSRRRDRAFVKINAGALPENLLESELFGAEAGAFTGASKMRVGRFEAADAGTLFLDEVGNLSLAGQMKLLRVLQTGEFQRLGSHLTKKVDVRLISATNADLAQGIAAKTFREDLFFRLNVIELKVPPLSARTDDLVPLTTHLLESFGVHAASGEKWTLGDSARAAILSHPWPGNVRELQNRLRRATLIANEPRITRADLGLEGDGAVLSPSMLPQAADTDADADRNAPDRAAVEEALVRANGNVSKAATELGLSRQALYRRMDRLGIVLERRPRGA
jgi:DNA-binding NtrC family response regulator